MVLPHYFVEQQIQKRARQLWEEEGKIDGKAHEHWARAESEILEKIQKGELEIDLTPILGHIKSVVPSLG